MARRTSIQILNILLEIISRFPHGATLMDILQSLSEPLARRSVQRYLAVLTKEGRLNISGDTRSTRYHLLSIESEKVFEASKERLIPLSEEALFIEAIVRKPIQAGRPIGYNRGFFNNYRLNEVYYLSEKIRKHLFEIGESLDGMGPAGTYARRIFSRLLIDLSWNSSRLEGNAYVCYIGKTLV